MKTRIYKWIKLEVHDDIGCIDYIPCEMDHGDIVKVKKYVEAYKFYNEMKQTTFRKPELEVK